MSKRQSWTIDSDLDGIDLQPEDFMLSVLLRKVPTGDVFEASRAGDVERLRYLLECGVNVNARDQWDSVALYYACLAGHLDVARMLLESGAICSEHTFDGDRCHYAALNLKVRKLLKAFEARPPPLAPLQAALRETFLSCGANRAYLEQPGSNSNISGYLAEKLASSHFCPDIVFYVQGRPLEAHRVILSARSPFLKLKFEIDWKDRSEVRFSKDGLSYPALYSLIHFFYSDRLEVKVDDMGDLVQICKVCKCEALQKVLERELVHQKYAEYKALRDVDNSQKRFILQASALPEKDRLPASLRNVLQISLFNSTKQEKSQKCWDELFPSAATGMTEYSDDLADVCIKVDNEIIRSHQVVLASRSEYFRARISHLKEFHEGKDRSGVMALPYFEEHGISMEVFKKIIEYMYTDELKEVDLIQVEDLFDAASRYLLFPMKRAIADVLLPHLETAAYAELCHWLMLADMYGVSKLREYCLGVIAVNFDAFTDTHDFRAMLLILPPPSGVSSLRTTLPSGPGAAGNTGHGNLLDDLRDRWLEVEAAELDKRDESAMLFDKRLEVLIRMAEQEQSYTVDDATSPSPKAG